ncbi:large ribosomal subunit protein eL14-like [Convolutriloba macropyga]|uniref:large ribosomal subunit protein eL14-like n=1 Tax=Convolutriloba macropyga TaxID=536237 RepID=UPI003F52326C
MSAEGVESKQIFVEIGRVALIQQKRYKNKLAVIVNVIDQRRAICDIFHPHGKDVRLVARASIALKTMRLTKLVVKGIQWNSHSKFVTDKYKEADIQEKFQDTQFYKAWQNKMKRDSLNDYERFKCEYIKRKRFAIIKKKMAELKKAKTVAAK